MARRGLGGGDFSSSFASLYNFNKNEAKAKQDADDADAADRWSNGLMSDDEWLSYIEQRIAATAGDPKEHQKWITAQRKYASAIGDKQAESDYENGGSINQLIGYYQQKLGGMVKDSNEYRDVQSRLNDLIDKRTGDSLTDQAKALMDQINVGKADYGDLKKLLETAYVDARNNSSLKKSIKDQLDQVVETIRTNKVEGAFERLQYKYDSGSLSGAGYAKQLRAMAGQFKQSDPKRYYQILEAAVALEKQGGRRSGGGGGSGSGGGSGMSAAARKSINTSIDAIQAKRTNIEAMFAQYEAGAKKGINPATGQVVVFSPGFVHELDKQYINVEDDLTVAYTKKGDLSAAATAQKYKAQHIATRVVQHNSIAAEDQRRELMVSTSKLLDNALANPDPTSAMNTVSFVAKQWEDFSRGLTQNVTTVENADGRQHQVGTPKSMIDQVDGDLIGQAQSLAGALRTLSTPGIDDASASAALESLFAITGKTAANGDPASNPFVALGKRALEVNGRLQGIQTGDVVRVATPNGLQWVRTVPVGQDIPDPAGGGSMVHVTTKVPDLPDVDPQKGTKFVDVFVDVNGTPTKMKAVATLTSPQGYDVWQSKQEISSSDLKKLGLNVSLNLGKGVVLTEDVIRKLGGAQKLADAGLIERKAAFQTWQIQMPSSTNAQGKLTPGALWSEDPRTGMWYQGTLPVRGVQRLDDGTVLVTKDGAQIDWKAYSSAAGAPAPYVGSNPKAMQDLLNTGVVDVSQLRSTDALGKVTDEAPDLTMAYFNPARDNKSDPSLRDSWWRDDEREGQRKQYEHERLTAEELAVQNRRKLQGPGEGFSPDHNVMSLASTLGIQLAFEKNQKDMASQQAGHLQDLFDTIGMPKKDQSKSSLPAIRNPDVSSGPAITAEKGKAIGSAVGGALGALNIKPSSKAAPPKVNSAVAAELAAEKKKQPPKSDPKTQSSKIQPPKPATNAGSGNRKYAL